MRTPAINRATIAIAACTIALLACSGQDARMHAHLQASDATAADTPHVEVRVDKHYDDRGDLIAYDSTYVSIRSGGFGGPAAMDSLFRDLRSSFGRRHPFLNDPGCDDPLFNDSLLFPNGLFRKYMELDQHRLERMMHEMDRVKNERLRRYAPPSPEHTGTI